jgi:hypothetical protein
MRFAVLEMKLFLAEFLLNFDVIQDESIPKEMEYVEGTVRRPKNDLKIKIKKRLINSS